MITIIIVAAAIILIARYSSGSTPRIDEDAAKSDAFRSETEKLNFQLRRR